MAENELHQSMGDSNKCQICLQTRNELKTLNCQHSFCLHCLQDWMNKKGEMECPNCRQVQRICEGGLKELPSKTNIEGTEEHLVEGHGDRKCYCGKENAEFFCQDCRQCICSFCKHSHDFLPALRNHTLEPINTNWPTEEPEPLCPQHEKKFEFYCNICKTPICQKCTVTDHSKDEGEHEPIRASEAFNDFKLTANALMARADIHKQQIQVCINKCIANISDLIRSITCLKKDMNNTVEEIVKLVSEKGEALEAKLDDVCEAKQEKSNSQIDELESIISGVKEKQEYIAKLLKSGEATALQTFEQVIIELQEKIAVLPETEARDDGKVYSSSNKDQILNTLRKLDIGSVTEKPDANIFEIVPGYPNTVTHNQSFHVKIVQNSKCEVDIKDLQAKWFFNDKNWSNCGKVEQTGEREYIVSSAYMSWTCSTMKLHVKFCNASIKGSPITINIKSQCTLTIIDNIANNEKGISTLFWSQNGYFLMGCHTNEIFKVTNAGAYMSKIELSQKSRISGICELKNNNLIFCDWGSTNITICKQDGQVIKSISTGLASQSSPTGIDVNEDLNLVYVSDLTANCVYAFDMESNSKVKTIGFKGFLEGQINEVSDVAVIKNGNLIVADNSRIQLFDKDGQFMNLLVGGGKKTGMVLKPFKVVVDYDENIIVASEGKVQLFDSQGKFVKELYQNVNRKCANYVISVLSQYPRVLALAELNSNKIDVVYY
ncbi:E3 ubiquitin-protein ligase TRIM71-like [Anneissia japonica]|uniref:E3 ubiquitin-protein ligase TRIM71-like n=1 Tax=Anneissia japonica TaxID=1529436 RepID=UPI0014256BD6|nr:E3 ubiquitin-protein ligase TRIM71-like [Anneissia japonica]XP_033123968.1 E3 ubiquitin-protein ligase TRIM71-like [Anneissia japonica]